MHLTGNKPPWTLASKSKYLARDAPRAASRAGITRFAAPPDFLSRARTQSALRALLFIKAHFPRETFLSALRFLFYRFWTPPNADVVAEDSLRGLLAEATRDAAGEGAAAAGGGGGKDRLFSRDEVDGIMDGRAQMKEVLAEETGRAVEAGAFGCPWLLVTDSKGKVEPFFGSDRFNHIYRHLGIPFQDIAILAPASGSETASGAAAERSPKL
ncbi:hypothetical protein E4U43_002812 [Claviceps pusilla]|uniref:DSBA-like thioredoxin domain-containing protein n=1 Tax=Claviceps pusilla TaxID=123648 RepID=A0A9P7N621_9HYPO|nr:hypothetical protein E4U43_002812 [Claviceps pusilla]